MTLPTLRKTWGDTAPKLFNTDEAKKYLIENISKVMENCGYDRKVSVEINDKVASVTMELPQSLDFITIECQLGVDYPDEQFAKDIHSLFHSERVKKDRKNSKRRRRKRRGRW